MILEMINYCICKGSLIQQKTRYPQLLWRLVALRGHRMVVPRASEQAKVHVDPGNHHVMQADEMNVKVRIQLTDVLQVAEGCVVVGGYYAPQITPQTLYSLIMHTFSRYVAPSVCVEGKKGRKEGRKRKSKQVWSGHRSQAH